MREEGGERAPPFNGSSHRRRGWAQKGRLFIGEEEGGEKLVYVSAHSGRRRERGV